jgi:CRISPR-associated DxTHG motif protein
VTLDVTHAFRHLPMLALVAARYLTRVRGIAVENIYYGALTMEDPATGETPVLRLGGLLRMMDWVDALATYDKDGDYGVFAELLTNDGMEPGRSSLLAKAAYFERTGNPVKARETLTSVFGSVESHGGALGNLFRQELRERISWHRRTSRHEWELELSDAYLERRDYLRAATFLQEAWVSREVFTRKADTNDYKERESAREHGRKTDGKFNILSKLRNAMTHGVRKDDKDKEVQKTLNGENKLRLELAAIRKRLFG